MCQASVGRVLTVKGDKGTVEFRSKKLELNTELVNIKKGDYVLFSGGIAIQKLSKEEALKVMGYGSE